MRPKDYTQCDNQWYTTPGWKLNLDESQCTGAIDSANNAI